MRARSQARAARSACGGYGGAAITIAAIIVVGCTRDRSALRAHAADSVAAEAAAVLPPPPATLSRFDVPLEYDFSPILPVVERVVPKSFGSLDSVHMVGTDTRKHYAFFATRDTFTTTAHGRDVHLRTTLSYEARGFYKPLIGPTLSAGCGNSDKRPRIVIDLVTPLTLTRTWHLHSSARLAHLAPASAESRDRCHVSILSFDVTDRVVDAARQALTTHMADIDRKIGSVDLTGQATGWWQVLNRPIPLATGVWLLLRPHQMRLANVAGDGHTLTMRAGLDAYPEIVTGAEPHPVVSALPPLAKDSVKNGFDILLEGTVDFLTASHAITEALGGKSVSLGSRSVTVRSVIASPDVAGKLALTVTFSGDAAGTLRFVGTPHYDRRVGKVDVPDLHFDLSTNSDLINAYAWLRSDALLAVFREKAQIPVAPVLEKGKGLLAAGLNRTIGDVMTLSATVDSVSVRGLFVTRSGLVVRAGATGNARVSVRRRS